MALQAKWYGRGFLAVFNKEVDWDSDTVKVALMSGSYTPDQDAHDYFSDVVAHEASGTGYVAGGKTLTTRSRGYDGGTNILKLDADDVVWDNSSITAAYAVIYVDTGTDSTSPLLGYVDFGGIFASNVSEFALNWSADGVLRVSVL